MKKVVTAKELAKLKVPLSHAVIANGFVFVSGQTPLDTGTGSVPDAFEDQVEQTLKNLQSVLEAAGSGLEHVVKVNAYLTDITRFSAFNTVYQSFFAELPPARTTVMAGLINILVEIDCIATVHEEV